jgi:hypothetical protein
VNGRAGVGLVAGSVRRAAGCGLVAHRAISSGPVAPRARKEMGQGATGPKRLRPRGPQGPNRDGPGGHRPER